MNLTLSLWALLLGRLAIEAGLLVTMAAGIQGVVKSPGMRRTVWQAVFLGVGLTWGCEVGGARRWVTEMSNSGETNQRFVTQVDFGEEASVPPHEIQAFTERDSIEPIHQIPTSQNSWWPLWVWVGGAAFVGLRALGVRIWLTVAASRASRPVTDATVLTTVEDLRRRVRLGRVRMVVWPGLYSPIAFGSLRPTIALPEGFTERFDSGEQETMLAHELAHLAAGDPFWLGVADLVLAMAWWHPGLWWSRHQLREACESAADEASALVPGGRVFLAELLVKLGRDLVATGVTPGLGIGGNLRSRLAKRVTVLLSDAREWRQESTAKRWLTRATAPALAALLVAVPVPGTSGPALFSILLASPLSANTPPETGSSARDAEARSLKSTPADELIPKSTNNLSAGSTVPRTNVDAAAGTLPGTAPQSPLLTREYRLDSDKFRLYLRRFVPKAGSNLLDTDIEVALRGFAASFGVTFPVPMMNFSGSLAISQMEPPAIYFDAHRGELLVRATEADLERMDRAIKKLATWWTKRQVRLEFKFLEVTESGGGGLDLDWLFGETLTNRPVAQSVALKELLKESHLPTGPTITVDEIQSYGQSAELTPAQFSSLLKRLVDRDGTDVLSSPNIVTLSGRAAQISLLGDRTIVTGIDTNRNGVSYTTQACKVGRSVMLVPELEGNEVKLSLSSTVTEFLGYDAPKSGVELRFTTPAGQTLTGQQAFPHFRSRLLEANITGKLRNTCVLRGPMVTNVVQFKSKVPVLGDIPLMGRLFREEGTSQILKRLYIFITPIEVDGAGRAM